MPSHVLLANEIWREHGIKVDISKEMVSAGIPTVGVIVSVDGEEHDALIAMKEPIILFMIRLHPICPQPKRNMLNPKPKLLSNPKFPKP